MEYGLLAAFRDLFKGKKYEHRKSTHGDHVASFLYEDLLALGRSAKLVDRVRTGRAVVNTANLTVGRTARRGDGTFGETVPGLTPVVAPGFAVMRGRIASVEIGAETKILAKAMIKQVDRVINDLEKQVSHFRTSSPRAISVAIVGINQAEGYVSFEGTRRFATDGKRHKHPAQEAGEAERRLLQHARSAYDEFLLLRFRATNRRPYPFEWVDEPETQIEYAAALTRISNEYEARF